MRLQYVLKKEIRQLAIKAPSGMGKSSLISKVSAMANRAKKNRKDIELSSIEQIFEEGYISKKELWGLFDSIRNLSNMIDAEKQNFILGFAWKTDSFVPLDHPAYAMWSDLRDRRKD